MHAGRRTIIIACKSELIRDRWLAAIEYLKTKAIFDAYAKKNTLVNFMGDQHQEQKEQENEEMDMNDLLYDFGGKLIGNTMQNIVGKNLQPNVMKRRFTQLTSEFNQ